MRRGRWVAALVLVGVGIVLFLGAEDVLYERRTSEDAVVYYERSWDWMPVPEFIVPDPLCMECQQGDHDQCPTSDGERSFPAALNHHPYAG